MLNWLWVYSSSVSQPPLFYGESRNEPQKIVDQDFASFKFQGILE